MLSKWVAIETEARLCSVRRSLIVSWVLPSKAVVIDGVVMTATTYSVAPFVLHREARYVGVSHDTYPRVDYPTGPIIPPR